MEKNLLGKQKLSITYQAEQGRKEQEKGGRVVSASRGHIHFSPSDNERLARQRRTKLG